MWVEVKEFRKRLQIYPKINGYDDDFSRFWRWKLVTESENLHILDEKNRDITYSRLCDMAKKWQVYRGSPNFNWRVTLKDSLVKISEPYNQIRRYTLLEFDNIPQEPLELIWHELGCVKEKDGYKNPDGYYYAIAITKPLMFLWGQTLAFDLNVREFMPNFGIQKTVFKATKWYFKTWREVMKGFSEKLREDSALVDLFKEESAKKYGNDSVVPYGRFLDIYYWIGGLPYEKIYEATKKMQM